jgi:hypothetical protein
MAHNDSRRNFFRGHQEFSITVIPGNTIRITAQHQLSGRSMKSVTQSTLYMDAPDKPWHDEKVVQGVYPMVDTLQTAFALTPEFCKVYLIN